MAFTVASLRYWQVKAQRARSMSGDGFDAALAQGYSSLFDFVDVNKDDPDMRYIESLLLEERSESLEAERAWQHFACRGASVANRQWEPLVRPTGRL